MSRGGKIQHGWFRDSTSVSKPIKAFFVFAIVTLFCWVAWQEMRLKTLEGVVVTIRSSDAEKLRLLNEIKSSVQIVEANVTTTHEKKSVAQ